MKEVFLAIEGLRTVYDPLVQSMGCFLAKLQFIEPRAQPATDGRQSGKGQQRTQKPARNAFPDPLVGTRFRTSELRFGDHLGLENLSKTISEGM